MKCISLYKQLIYASNKIGKYSNVCCLGSSNHVMFWSSFIFCTIKASWYVNVCRFNQCKRNKTILKWLLHCWIWNISIWNGYKTVILKQKPHFPKITKTYAKIEYNYVLSKLTHPWQWQEKFIYFIVIL